MIMLILIFYVMVIHWVADFILQTHEQAMNKSTSMGALLAHTITYTAVWFVSLISFAGGSHNLSLNMMLMILLFCLITFICHTITDYFTSRETRRLFGKGDYHNGFVVVGLDQILHYIQLYTTIYLLIKY